MVWRAGLRPDQIGAYLHQQRQHSLYRQRDILNSPQGIQVELQGKSYLSFCSNDYLGLANHPRLVAAAKSALDHAGVGSGAAHLISGHHQFHHELEQQLAEFVGSEAALVFSTGYMANTGVISALLGKADVIFADKLNHASLVDGCLLSRARLLRYRHGDMEHLQQLLQQGNTTAKNTGMLVTDGIFSMDGDMAPLTALSHLAKQHQLWLLLDDAHGFGVMGNRGRGTLEALNLSSQDVNIVVGTFGKAFGTFGAFVAGSRELIETLIQRCRSYIYTTALPPSIAAATSESLFLVTQENWRREKLRENIAYFRRIMAQLGLNLLPSCSPIHALLVGTSERALLLSQQLRQQGLLVQAIRPPTVPAGGARLRITLCSTHEPRHIDQLGNALKQLAITA